MIDLRSDTRHASHAGHEEGDGPRRRWGTTFTGRIPRSPPGGEGGRVCLGKEAGLFVPTGSMGNEVAVAVHTRPGDEVILEADCHIMNYELGTMAAFAGAMPCPVRGDRGFPTAGQVEVAIRPPIYYCSRSTLLCLENTQQHAGGGIYPRDRFRAVVDLARRRGLKVHLDGARIFNASVASGVPAAELAEGADSVMFCLSKGLGAPVGSMLVGTRAFIEEAVAMRKRMGGGMRQVGILAAAGLFALEMMVERLAEDHANARVLADRLAEIPGIEIDPATVETNIVIFRSARVPAGSLAERLKAAGVLCLAISADRVADGHPPRRQPRTGPQSRRRGPPDRRLRRSREEKRFLTPFERLR